MSLRQLTIWLPLTLVLAACNGLGNAPPIRGAALAELAPASGCGQVLDQLKARAFSQMQTAVDQNLDQLLAIIESGGCEMYGGGEDDSMTAAAGATNGGATPTDSAQEYSTTNDQVAGVDEADFMKNDGQYIYIIANNKFQILAAWPTASMQRIAEVAVEGTPNKLFVNHSRAVVYSALGTVAQDSSTSEGPYGMGYSSGVGGDCTYGYDCDFTGDGQILKITVFDLSTITAPTVVREIVFTGSYVNSRRIDDIVHTVVVSPEVSVPGITTWPAGLNNNWSLCDQNGHPTYSEDDIRAMFDALKVANAAIIDASTITNYLPGIKDTRYINGKAVVSENLLQDCGNFYVSQSGDGASFVSLVSFDLSAQAAIGATTVVGKPGAVYASTESLYLAVRHEATSSYGWYYNESDAIDEATTIHKFHLTPGSNVTSYLGSGVVKGLILNQFSMDEYLGNLRIATTMGHVPDPNVYSTVSVVSDSGVGLVVAGMVDHLAPTEDIRAVRFSEGTGFVVTFKKTDPLFVLDLTQPANPVLKGELQIPGFSTYLQMMDATHLLAIGYDADDQGSFAWFKGLMLQIFDVSDMSNPTLLHREYIGTRGSGSAAATNHLAFNYFAAENLLAIPIAICEGGGDGGDYGDLLTFGGLLVYRVTVDNGFVKLGGLAHQTPETQATYSDACGQWWADGTSQVKRSIFMDNFVYSIALDLVLAASLDDVSQPISQVNLMN